jgi:hypothetical protein
MDSRALVGGTEALGFAGCIEVSRRREERAPTERAVSTNEKSAPT